MKNEIQLLKKAFGIFNPKKISIDSSCNVCGKKATYINGDGLLTFWFVCEEHKDLKLIYKKESDEMVFTLK